MRASYAVLRQDPSFVYLDHATTGLLSDGVREAVAEMLVAGGTAGRTSHPLGHAATGAYEGARRTVAGWFGAAPEEIVFAASATAGLNLVATGWGRAHLLPGDRIVVDGLAHHAGLLPWRAVAAEVGARVQIVRLTRTGDLDLEDLEQLLQQQPRVLVLTHVSNVTGGVVDLGRVIGRVRDLAPDCLVVVDGCQAVPHLVPEPAWRRADVYVFSGHKLGGPPGLGVVWAPRARWAEFVPAVWGGGMVAGVSDSGQELAPAPWRFEAGTPPHLAAVGLAVALQDERVDVAPLVEVAARGLQWLPGVTVVGDPARRVGLVAFVVDGWHAHDVASHLATAGIAVRAGHLCAEPAVRRLGHEAVVRASFGPGNGPDDVTALLDAVRRCAETR
jgi:cysteine desulfurase/selenocysteine lyase